MFRAIIHITFVALVFLVPIAAGQSSPTWEKVSSADGRFEVSFPAAASRDVKHLKTASGDYAQMTTYKAEYRDGAFFVTYTDFPYQIDDPQFALEKIQEGFIGGVNAKVVSASASTFMGHPARTFQARTEIQGQSIRFTVKAFVVDRRVYQIAVGRFESRMDEPENDRFLSSFRITSLPEKGRGLTAE